MGIQAADKAGMGLGGTPGWVGTRGWVRMAGWVFILPGRLQSVPLCPCAPALMLWAKGCAAPTGLRPPEARALQLIRVLIPRSWRVTASTNFLRLSHLVSHITK